MTVSKGSAEQPTAQVPRSQGSPTGVEVSEEGRQDRPEGPGTAAPQSPPAPGSRDQSGSNGAQARTPTAADNAPTPEVQGQEPSSWTGPAPRRTRAGRISGKQRQAIEHMRHAVQELGRLVEKQPPRRRAGRQGDETPHRCLTGLAPTDGILHPASRPLLFDSRADLDWGALQDGFRLLPSLIVRQPGEARRDRAPAGQPPPTAAPANDSGVWRIRRSSRQ